ncbi:MAG: hypothetical protein PHR45_07820 [Muribaculaceae bacterium]|nr:hypothetical protein [Muribaculaceae bacterium]
MCRPFDSEEYYFYPARRFVAVAYILTALQVPYLLFPESTDVWLFIRIWGVIFYGISFSIIFQRYFFKSKAIKIIQKSVLAIAILFLFLLFAIATLGGNYLAPYANYIIVAGTIIGIATTVLLTTSLLHLKQIIYNYHRDGFSNREDFPYRFAQRIIFVPLVGMIFVWLIMFCDNKLLKSGTDVLFTVLQSILLIVILHPQRNRSVQERILQQEENLIIKSNLKDDDLLYNDIDDKIDKEAAKIEELHKLLLKVKFTNYFFSTRILTAIK